MHPDDPDPQPLWSDAIAKFERLLELPAGERDAALAAEPDPAVRTLLAQWLRNHGRTSGVLDIHVQQAVDPAATVDARRLGRWQLEARIGHGGMATVYRAHSLSPPLGQQAAVKVMSLGVLAQQGSERFLQEQQTLSRMRHPGIAGLFDAGVDGDGTPWFAMALVEGERIDRWCDTRDSSVDGRAALVLQLCEAVGYAHRNLVIHRDIKPSNVLVDADGHAILLDFGIARLAEDIESEQTATALRMLTPEYAAPEQFTAAPASTAMDVYGLGALLYRLLAGVPPAAAAPEARTRTAPPSRACMRGSDDDPPRRLRWSRQLRGDLDTIVMKALAHDPEQRYASVDALAEDLRRWRATRPILAHPPSLRYRARRYLQRHRWGVAAGVAIFVAAGAGIAGIAWQGQQARLQAERAELTRDFLREVFAEANPLQRGNRGADIEAVLRGAAAQAPVRFADRPDLQAETLQLVGELQRLNGDNIAAADTLAKAWALQPDRARWDDNRRRAVLSLAGSLAAIGKPAEARTLLADWLARDTGPQAAGILHCRGHGELSRLEDNIAQARDRLEGVRAACLALPAGTPARTGIAAALSSARRLDGDHAGAMALVEAEDAALAALPALSAEAWVERLRLATERAQGLRFLRRDADAERLIGTRVAQAGAVIGHDSVFLASPLQVRAGLLNRLDRGDEAEASLRRALALVEQDGRVQNRPLKARVLMDLGVTAHNRDRPAEAEAYWRQAIDAFAAAGQDTVLDVGMTLSNLAYATAARGAHDEAEGFGRRAVAFLDAHAPERLDKIAMAEFNLCIALAQQRKPEAIAHCRRGATLDRTFTPDDIALIGEGQQYLADAHCLLRDWQPALDAADRAIALLVPLDAAPDAAAAHALWLARHHRVEALAGLGRLDLARRELSTLSPGYDWPAMARARLAVAQGAAKG